MASWAENPEKIRAYGRKRNAKITPKGKLNRSIKGEIWRCLKGSKAGRHWEDLVGYNLDQLKKHLEKQFNLDMTWENYGSYWHVDHKVPIAVFNFEKPEDIDFHLCWSLKNLQPLESKKNLSKQDKIKKSFQPSLCIKYKG